MDRYNNRLTYLAVGLAVVVAACLWFRSRQSPAELTDLPGGTAPKANQPGAHQIPRADNARKSSPAETAPAYEPTRPACISHGTVRWEDGEPVAGAEIQIFQSIQSEKVQGDAPHVWLPTGHSTNSHGRYRLPEHAVCPLRLAASLGGQGWAEETRSPVESGVVPPNEIQRDLTMLAARPVEGRCMDEGGRPVEGAKISATSTFLESGAWRQIPRADRSPDHMDFVSRRWAHQTYTDESGAFRFAALPTDEWTLLAEADGYVPAGIRTDNSDANGPPLVVVLDELMCWVVSVVDEQGAAVPDASVAVEGGLVSVHRMEKLTTDKNGTVEVCETAPRGALIIARAESMVTEWLYNETGDPAVTVTLGHGVRLKGTLLPPVVEDEACSVSGTGFIGNVQAMNLPRFSTDDQGRFDIDSVPPGTVDLRLLCRGYHPAKVTVTLEPNTTIDLGVVSHEPKAEWGQPPPKDVWSPFAD